MTRWTSCCWDVSIILEVSLTFYSCVGDGIFDKITNEEVLKQAWVAAKRNYRQRDQPVHQICGNIVELVMKDSIAYKTLDNITVVLLAFNNLKVALNDELINGSSASEAEERENGQVGGTTNQDQQSQASNEPHLPPHLKNNNNTSDEKIDNADSSNGGLVYSENKEVSGLNRDDICKALALPNLDLSYEDVQVMIKKPRMPKQNISNQTIPSLSGGIDKLPRTSGEEQMHAKGAIPNSTKASHSRMFNMPPGGQAAPETTRNDNAMHEQQQPGGQPGNIHKSFNGSMPKQGGGLQPTTNFKGNMMPVIGSGQGLPTDQLPKSSGFRTNRNQQYEYNLNLQNQQFDSQ